VSDYLLLAFGVVLTIGTGLFVASEFALINTDRVELETAKNEGQKGLELPLRAIGKTATHLSAAQLGITLTTLLTGYVLEPSVSRLISPWLLTIGVPDSSLSGWSIFLALVIATLFSFLIGELVPKNMALSEPIRVLKLIIGFQLAFTWLFYPLVRFLNENGNYLLRKMGIEPKEELSAARSAEELASLVRRSASLGSLEQDTAELIEKTIELQLLTASDIMTPRVKMISLDRDATANELIALAAKTGHSRFPVIGEDADDVVGVVHLKRAVSIPVERREQVPVSALMIEPVRVPDTMPLDRFLLQLRGKGLQIGIIIDEYGGTAGLATLEDAIEELVGDLADEHDRARFEIARYSDGSLSFSGLTRPAELEEYELKIAEDEDYDTVAGFVMSELGRIPEVGDELVIPGGRISVTRMDGRRVDRLRYTPEVSDE
jgi:CBS domain containing-hemolysin-like protein